ncbi:hypothetical protein ASPBRDRAFT_136800, partial [Aspergillus brasiliensis CBS 101740]
RRRQLLQSFSQMRGRTASLVEPISFGMSALAIGSAHCGHAPSGTGLVALTYWIQSRYTPSEAVEIFY